MRAPSDDSPSASRVVALVARREATLLARSRAGRVAVLLVFAVAWLPPILVALRAGRLGIASFAELTPLALALCAVLLPLLALLAGCGSFAAELEDRTIVPLLCLPVSRTHCYLGKLLGLGLPLGALSAVAFASVAVAVAAVRGSEGGVDYLVVSLGGLLLGASCLVVGAAIGVGGRGRVRAYGATLIAWLVLVFALDAVLLAAVLVSSPPPPETVGHHGHDELSMPSTSAGRSESEGGSIDAVWMAVDPVSLFRWSALTLSPRLRARLRFAPGSSGRAREAGVIGLGWLVWILAPGVFGWRRFRRLSLG
jgi:ABC-type transport system involved in multi-copper enzyme maturation permease subunit